MNETGAVAVLSILKAAYPNSFKEYSRQDAQGAISIWATQLADVPDDIVLIAVRKLIATSKFIPTIAEVREKINSIKYEAEELLWLRQSRLKLQQMISDSEPLEINEYTETESTAKYICEQLKHFKKDIALYTLIQSGGISLPPEILAITSIAKP